MSDDRPRRKLIRLPRDAYSQPDAAWLISIAVKDRAARPFEDVTLGRAVLDSLVTVSEGRLTLFVAVVMPDHVHLVVALDSGKLIDQLSVLKSATTRVWWSHGGKGLLWQRSFHDRGLRGSEIFDKAVSYVLMNPVEDGLVDEWSHYPLLGSSLVAHPTQGQPMRRRRSGPRSGVRDRATRVVIGGQSGLFG